MLVLVILVLMASLAGPSLFGSLERRQLMRAADVVRIEWSRTRVKAITKGITYAFRFQNDSGSYSIVPWVSGGMSATGEVASASNVDSTRQPSAGALQETSNVQAPSFYDELPAGIYFASFDRVSSSRELAIDTTRDMTSSAGETESEPIFFFPDGRTSTANLVVASEEGLGVTLSLRGLTGVTRVTEPAKLEDAGNAPN